MGIRSKEELLKEAENTDIETAFLEAYIDIRDTLIDIRDIMKTMVEEVIKSEDEQEPEEPAPPTEDPDRDGELKDDGDK